MRSEFQILANVVVKNTLAGDNSYQPHCFSLDSGARTGRCS